jgi:DNA-binding PadR family transcriptional regulator
MPQQLRLTRTTRAVLQALLDGFQEDLWGLRVCHETGLPSGTVYPLLTRLEDLGWVVTAWEDVGSGAERSTGPRRRFYRLTPDGLARTREVLAERDRLTLSSLVRSQPAAGAA